jgi:hypothetical protein
MAKKKKSEEIDGVSEDVYTGEPDPDYSEGRMPECMKLPREE